MRAIDQNASQDLQSLEKFNAFERMFCTQGYISSYLPHWLQDDAKTKKTFGAISKLTKTQKTQLRKLVYQSCNFIEMSNSIPKVNPAASFGDLL